MKYIYLHLICTHTCCTHVIETEAPLQRKTSFTLIYDLRWGDIFSFKHIKNPYNVSLILRLVSDIFSSITLNVATTGNV